MTIEVPVHADATVAEKWNCDVLIVGSGAGGLASAVACGILGFDVCLVEKAEFFGGVTAFSGGVVWVPGSAAALKAGYEDGPERALTYLRAHIGNRFDQERVAAYVNTAPQALAFFEDNSAVKYELAPGFLDYKTEEPGAMLGGRSLDPAPFDGRKLGSLRAKVRPPLKTMTILGGMMIPRQDLAHFLNYSRSVKSLVKVARLVLGYWRDRVVHKRPMLMTGGNALIGALLKTASDLGVRLHLNTALKELRTQEGEVKGAVIQQGDRRIEVAARLGVVLAAGGICWDEEVKRQLYPHVAAGARHYPFAPKTNSGDSHRMAEAIGAQFVESLTHPAAWCPASEVPQTDGSTALFPHFRERGKAGFVLVNQEGRRFTNEAVSYHSVSPAIMEEAQRGHGSGVWLICDHRAIRTSGLGVVPPGPLPLRKYVHNGYLKRGSTIAGLATAIGVDPIVLDETIARYNLSAEDGEDPEFHRGTTAYQRSFGTPGMAPNPCVAPLRTGPFYAVRVVPGDLSSFAGLATDADARVLDQRGVAIPRLFAVGADMASIMGGSYPGAGITIGPALTFAYRAAKAMASMNI